MLGRVNVRTPDGGELSSPSSACSRALTPVRGDDLRARDGVRLPGWSGDRREAARAGRGLPLATGV